MKVFSRTVFVFVASFFGATAIAAEFDGSEPLMCSFAQIVECDAGAECRSVTNESIDAPDFVRFDFKKKQVIAIAAGVENAPADLGNVINLTNYLIVQGVQGGAQGAANSLAWSATIDHESGHISMAAAGEKAGFVVFGACTTIWVHYMCRTELRSGWSVVNCAPVASTWSFRPRLNRNGSQRPLQMIGVDGNIGISQEYLQLVAAGHGVFQGFR